MKDNKTKGFVETAKSLLGASPLWTLDPDGNIKTREIITVCPQGQDTESGL